MTRRVPLTISERRIIYESKLAGKTLTEIAEVLGCSQACVRKWWRRGRKQGYAGLEDRVMGRPKEGPLSTFAPCVQERAQQYKALHPKWGADRVLAELERTEEFVGQRLPGRSQLTGYFKLVCPEAVRQWKERPPRPKRPVKAVAVHEIWQLDTQEGIHLQDGSVASICSVRDVYSGAIINSCAYEVTTEKHWRKLTTLEIQSLLREAFTVWETMPDAIQTDNELGLAGSSASDYPGRLTLWLRGLGIQHLLGRPGCPTDQAEIERNHRTLDGFAVDDLATIDLSTLHKRLADECYCHNHHFASRARHCQGQPPLQAHPLLLHARRPYQPEHEPTLFSLELVGDFLALFQFSRKVNAVGQVSLGNKLYQVGRDHAGLQALIRFDSQNWQWVFSCAATKSLWATLPPRDLDLPFLTALPQPLTVALSLPVQLTLPFFLSAST